MGLMQPCADEYCDVDWTAYLSEPTMPAPPPAQDLRPSYWAWGAIFIAVVVWELVAWLSKKMPTLSQGVQRGPRWFRWAMALGLSGLIYHLFLQGRFVVEVIR